MIAGGGQTAAPEVVAVGEALVAFLGQEPDLALVELRGFGVHVTGAELNSAVGLARLGHRVTFAGRVGRDPFGQMIRRRLAMEGVGTRWLADDDGPTGMLFRNMRRTAPAEVVYRRDGSAGSQLVAEDLEPAIRELSDGGLVLTTGVTAAVCPAATREIGRLARSSNRRLCVDLNHRTRLWRAADAAPALRALAAAAFLVVGGRDEALLVSGGVDTSAAARTLLSAGAEIVVLRHDTIAASWFTHDRPEPVTVRANVLPATDPVGAGDAFMAGLISGILEFGPAEPVACLARAHHCGAGVVATVGDLEGALYRSELALLESVGVPGEPIR
ncbi:MAG TPA: sugar kinase [Solirubrobacteraceae bacterium]|nr:sugar kinase [Solirubrobacteraceae bacterium]